MTATPLASLFMEKANAVSISVTEVASMADVFSYALHLCKEKEPYQNLLPKGVNSTTVAAKPADLGDAQKVIAAPGLAEEDLKALQKLGEKEGILVISCGLRNFVAGLDVSVTMATMGIAETATCVLDCSDEEVRLASMLCEDHVMVLPKSVLQQSSFDVEQAIEALQKKGPRFISFISGASRTADIERVLALGVHGPLQLHVLLLEA
ncbi:LutC/YkgG family protein [Desulfovibrio cuneatus]|uniref:LutC/YkgG family protein n=1 Tax=Desulfovibrio cuneatus TaxID=159728 RepID=UPI000429A661|nr:LUD domain-containing protein [Desulfovibrio cuneatus]